MRVFFLLCLEYHGDFPQYQCLFQVPDEVVLNFKCPKISHLPQSIRDKLPSPIPDAIGLWDSVLIPQILHECSDHQHRSYGHGMVRHVPQALLKGRVDMKQKNKVAGWDDPACKGTFIEVWWSQFNSHDPHGGRRELTPASCPLYIGHPLSQISKCNNKNI